MTPCGRAVVDEIHGQKGDVHEYEHARPSRGNFKALRQKKQTERDGNDEYGIVAAIGQYFPDVLNGAVDQYQAKDGQLREEAKSCESENSEESLEGKTPDGF